MNQYSAYWANKSCLQRLCRQMLSILLILYLNDINVYSSSIIFGFQTSNKYVCCDRSSSIITLTLFWNTFKYQCDVNPIKPNTYYSCHTSNITTTSQCITNPSDPIQYGLQIDSHHANTVQIDRIIVQNVRNGAITDIPYDIDFFCFNSSQFTQYKPGDYCNQNKWDIIPISNKQISAYKLFEFISKNESNVHVLDTATDCILCSNRINTPYYGGIGGIRHSVINQGRIAGISSWGIKPDGTLSNIQWIFDEFEATKSSNIIEHDESTLDIICDPFTLDVGDYIIGYNVIYSEFVFGLVLYTLQNKSYGCIDTMYNDSIDENSGIILYKDYHLTAFYSYWDDAFNSIAFEFTPFDDSDLCSYKYIAVESATSCVDANNVCEQEYNSTLATIITESDFQIANYIKNNIYKKEGSLEEMNLWIGLVYNIDTTQWLWMDGTSCNYTLSGKCVDDQHWALNEADINNGDNDKRCSVLSEIYDGYYENVGCSDKYMFLCNNPRFTETMNPSPTDSTEHPIATASETELVENELNDDGKSLQLNGQIVIGVGIILGCCMLPLLCGMMICCCMYYRESRIKINMKTKIKKKMMEIDTNTDVPTTTKQIERKQKIFKIQTADMEVLYTPKNVNPLKMSDPSQTTQNKGEIDDDNIDKKGLSKLSKPSLSNQDSLKKQDPEQLTDAYTSYTSIELDEGSSGITNEKMHTDSIIGGYAHNGIELAVIESKGEDVDQTQINLEIIDSKHEYALNGSLDTIMNVPSIPTTIGEKYRRIQIIDSQNEYTFNESLNTILNVPTIPTTDRRDDLYVD